jgi:hypothetical protein
MLLVRSAEPGICLEIKKRTGKLLIDFWSAYATLTISCARNSSPTVQTDFEKKCGWQVVKRSILKKILSLLLPCLIMFYSRLLVEQA